MPAIATPKNYDFRDVVATYAKVRISGFAEQGDAISVEPQEESVRSVMGPDGELGIVKGPQKPVNVTLRLMHTSASVGFLSDQANLQANARGAYVYPPLVISELNTGTTITLAQAWIKQQAPISYGNEIGVREFVIEGQAIINQRGVD